MPFVCAIPSTCFRPACRACGWEDPARRAGYRWRTPCLDRCSSWRSHAALVCLHTWSLTVLRTNTMVLPAGPLPRWGSSLMLVLSPPPIGSRRPHGTAEGVGATGPSSLNGASW